jgi:hypothetical protein
MFCSSRTFLRPDIAADEHSIMSFILGSLVNTWKWAKDLLNVEPAERRSSKTSLDTSSSYVSSKVLARLKSLYEQRISLRNSGT